MHLKVEKMNKYNTLKMAWLWDFFEFYNRLYTKRKDTEVFNIFYLKIMKKDGSELFCEKGDKISAVYAGEYSEGDKIILHCNEGSFVKMQLDEALKESIVYLQSGDFEFEIPYGALMAGYDKAAFSGNEHKISVSQPTDEEIFGTRNIALNSHDRRGHKKSYPHAYANFVTREDPCFFERNAIDGVCRNESHGGYPYVQEACMVCHRNANVYMEWSEYETWPFADGYVKAGNELIPDKLIFASAHPFYDSWERAKLYETLGFRPDVLENVLYNNAARILGIA